MITVFIRKLSDDHRGRLSAIVMVLVIRMITVVIRELYDDHRGRLSSVTMVLVIRIKLPDDHCHQKDL